MLFDLHGQRRPCSSRDEGRDSVDIRRRVVAGTSAGDSAVVLNTYEQPTWCNGGPIGETDDGLDELAVVEDRSLLSLELDIQCFAASNDAAELLHGHGYHATGPLATSPYQFLTDSAPSRMHPPRPEAAQERLTMNCTVLANGSYSQRRCPHVRPLRPTRRP